MKPVGKRALLLALLGGFYAVSAAQQPADSDPEAAAREQTGEDRQGQEQAAEQQPPAQPPPGPAAEEFEPTEQISEDLSVSFPVDI